jgi:hypothetical protein
VPSGTGKNEFLRGKTNFWEKTNFAGKNDFLRGKTNFARAFRHGYHLVYNKTQRFLGGKFEILGERQTSHQ